MMEGPRMNTAPFVPFNRSFLPSQLLRKAGFVKTNDMPYERNSATRDTHHEFFQITQESMFGAPVPKVLRLDSLREKFVISATEKGRGQFFDFCGIKSIEPDPMDPLKVTIQPTDNKLAVISFRMASPEITQQFVQRLQSLVQAKTMAK
jgi:hypothetical protein